MNKKKSSLIFFIFIFSFLLQKYAFADNIIMAVRAHSGVEKAVKRWQPTVEYLQQSLPQYNFKLLPIEGIKEMEEKVGANEVDFVITQPVAYVDLEQYFRVSRMLTLHKKYGTVFGSVIFTASTNDIQTLSDIKGKIIGGVTPKGFGGWLIGYNELLSNGIDPFKACKTVEYLGTHDNVVKAVLGGKIDVGIVRTGIIEKMAGAKEFDISQIKILNQQNNPDFPLLLSSKLYPEWALAKTKRVSESIAKEVAISLLAMPIDHIAAQKGHYQQWTIPLTYQPVHNLMQQLQIGSYSEYGKIRILQFMSQHFYKMVIFFFLLSITIIFVTKFILLKKSTQLLANEQEKLLVTLRSIGDGVITTDLNSKIDLINKVTEELTGWTQQEATGRPIQEVFNIINEKSGKSCANPVQKVIDTGGTVCLANHTCLIAKDGTRYSIEDSGAPIFNNNSEMVGTVLVFRDVTEEKKTEARLIKVKKLESVGVLAGGIAHDFNNILAAILGNIELAEHSISPANEAYPLLTEAKKASIRAKGLTQQLLTFAKGGDPVRQASSINKIIRSSADFVLHGSSVVCNYTMADNLWYTEVDTGQISQVVQNIVINARHAMPKGGVIKVSCQNVADITTEDSLLPAGKYVKITITDSGTGIPTKYIENIFDPYFSTKQEGSGLGLAICHSIINKHDGSISVQSEENKGTTFTIYLPASMNTPQGTISTESNIFEARNNGTIMIMDDDPMIRDITQKMLTRDGYEVLQARDGHEAIEIYNEYFKTNRCICVVIMDLTIPGGMGGKEAVKKILRINPDANVIVASGYSNDPTIAHFQEYGFKASISKPFQITELKKILNEVLQ